MRHCPAPQLHRTQTMVGLYKAAQSRTSGFFLSKLAKRVVVSGAMPGYSFTSEDEALLLPGAVT